MSIRHVDDTFPVFAGSRGNENTLGDTENVCMFHHQPHPGCFYVQVPLKGTFGKFIDKNGSQCVHDYIKHVIDFFPLNPGLQIYTII